MKFFGIFAILVLAVLALVGANPPTEHKHVSGGKDQHGHGKDTPAHVASPVLKDTPAHVASDAAKDPKVHASADAKDQHARKLRSAPGHKKHGGGGGHGYGYGHGR